MEWISSPANWAFLAISLLTLGAGLGVVTRNNVVHSALLLVVALAGAAALFLLLGAEFVAWVVVLIYIGAVIVLFLFGVMITRAPIGREARLDHDRRWPAALVAASIFGLMAGSSWVAFGTTPLEMTPDAVVRTAGVGEALFTRFVLPFEAVSFVLLAALIGGITLARRDPET
ncbi:MAG: NADH-quinone oxidoreductase subunit J [Actinomycetota bacterium]|nr:NADH-quinone oxidoreductase subunit J [Actinomycetota bacterium]